MRKTSKINLGDYAIEVGALSNSGFKKMLTERYHSSKKAIICDENTREFCLELLLTEFSELSQAEIIEIPAGEEHKNPEICLQVWEALSDYQFSRNDLIINLGGGMVGDLGGFVAGVFKRGMDHIHIPTSLLAMVDASIGGKTGVDLGKFKNQLGIFSNPKAVFIDPSFLMSLPVKEKYCGYAEMLKHGLIKSRSHWQKLIQIRPEAITEELIMESIHLKKDVVEHDPFEKGERKILNFGHTFGHGIEGFFLHTANEISHGHAVAIGMICEAYLSHVKGFLDQESFYEIKEVLINAYEMVQLSAEDFSSIYEIMLQDKKNDRDKIRCVLLKGIGEAIIDVELNKDDIFNALNQLAK